MNKEIISKLEPYFRTIHDCIMEGFNEAMTLVESSGQLLGKTAVSNIINDFIRSKVKSSFPKGSISANTQRLKVLLLNGINLRFKKLNNKHLAGNISTEQARKFASQQALPGMKSALNLNAGWVLDPTGRMIEAVFLTCPKTLYENHWSLNVSAYLDDNMSIYEPEIVKAIKNTVDSTEAIGVSVKPAAKKMRLQKKVQNE